MNKYTIEELEEALEVKKKRKKKTQFSKLIVSLVIALNIVFTISILYVFLKTGSEPIALVGAWFAFTTVELWSLSKIKREEKRLEDEC